MNSETINDPNQISSTPTQIIESPKKCKHLPIIIVLIILAVAGIGFGGFELWQNMQKNTEIDSYKNQIALKDEEISKLNLQKTESDNPTISPEQQPSSNDYIYVGEWGVKIKIPENLKGISYIYDNHSHLSLCVNGIANGGQYAPEFADIYKNVDGLGCITQYASGELAEEQKQGASFSNGDLYLIYSHPQAVYSIDKDEQNWEAESANLIQEMLTKNISAF